MNDLDFALRATYEARSRTPEPPALLHEVLAIPDLAIREQRGWLPQSPKWRFQSVFSATKFTVAGAIVALFGGFLLAGILTQPSDDRLPAVGASASATTPGESTDAATNEPEPTTSAQPDTTTTTPDLLPGVDLVTEEVEPGVFRVTSDGVRDLEWPANGSIGRSVTAGLDGTVLIAWNNAAGGCHGRCTAFRLGSPQVIEWSKKPLGPKSDKNAADWSVLPIEIGPDGTVYARAWGRNGNPDLRAWNGSAWEVLRKRENNGGVRQLVVDDEGNVWAALAQGLGRLDEDGWQNLKAGGRPFNQTATLLKTQGRPLRAISDARMWEVKGDRLREEAYLGSVPGPAGSNGGPAAGLTEDGTLWMLNGRGGLHRFRDGEWNTFAIEHDHNEWYMTWFAVAPSGGAWMGTDYYHPPLGMSHFDGETWTRVLDGLHIQAMDMAPDGVIWALAQEPDGPEGLFVITAEAMAGAE